MKLHVLAVTLLAFAAASARADYSHKEPFTKTAPFLANGTLSLENVNGDVEIRAWDKNEIRIDGEKSAETEEELKRIELTMDVSEAHAGIKVHLPKRSGGWFGGNTIRANVHFTITLPAGASIEKLQVVNSGVKIDGVHGNVRAESVNGTIKAAGLAGDVHLETVNGSIRAEFATVKGAQKLAFETVNGSIHVRVPANTGASVHAETVNGHISTDFPLTVNGHWIGRNLKGTIGDGQASIKAQTVNGGINLERS